MAYNPGLMDYNAMVAILPTGEGIDGVATTAQVDAIKAALVTHLDLLTGAGPARNITGPEYAIAYNNILVHFAHQGTSPYAVYKAHWNQNIGGAIVNNISLDDIAKVIRRTCSVRHFHRAEANNVYRISKLQSLRFNWGRENGVPEGFGYIGFDTADYITTPLSHEERKAINSAFHYAARFAATSVVTDTGDRWSAGTLSLPDTK
jgi:hypothetical protein